MDDGNVHVGLVLTGGTIGSIRIGDMVMIDLDDRSSAEIHLVERLWKGPGHLRVHTRVPVRKLSENMNQTDWLAIAAAVRELVEVDRVRDVLVFHGTDTAGFTAAALSFLLADLNATVVVTGSNIPASEPNSDAATNVGDALIAARNLSSGVFLSFAGVVGEPSEIHLGSAVRKLKAESQAYESPNLGPVARVVDGEVEIVHSWPHFQVDRSAPAMSDAVHMTYLFPGIDLTMEANALIASRKRGVVVRMYPSAIGPDNFGHDSLSCFVAKCIDNGIAVVACLERFTGSDATYPSLDAIERAGAIFAADMIPEVAYVKLCWALGQANNRAEAINTFIRPVAGESLIAARQLESV